MDLRRVQETGGTFLISLPRKWARRSSLNKGSIIAVVERDDGYLLLDPRYKLEKTFKTVMLSPSQYLEREIIGRYLLGFDKIEVEGKGRLSQNMREKARKTAHRFIGIEIIEEDANRIVLQCLFDVPSFPPDKILRREYLFASGMHKDVIVALLERDLNLANAIVQRDDEIDRLYFLLVRLLRAAVLNPHLSEKMRLSTIDCLDYRLVASFIESIGDCACEIAQRIVEFNRVPIPNDVLEAILHLSNLSNEMHDEAMRAFFSKDLELAEGILAKQKTVKDLIRNLNGFLGGRDLGVISYVTSVVSSLERISNYSVDISDIAAPR